MGPGRIRLDRSTPESGDRAGFALGNSASRLMSTRSRSKPNSPVPAGIRARRDGRLLTGADARDQLAHARRTGGGAGQRGGVEVGAGTKAGQQVRERFDAG